MELVGYFRGEGASRRIFKDDKGYFFITNPADDDDVLLKDFGIDPPQGEYRSDYAESPEELLLKCTPGFYWFRLDGSTVDFEKWYAIHRERLRTREGSENWI